MTQTSTLKQHLSANASEVSTYKSIVVVKVQVYKIVRKIRDIANDNEAEIAGAQPSG